MPLLPWLAPDLGAQIENRGCVGETVFHVCFLQGSAIHLHLAKRLLKHFPLLLNDIYLSDEYYGENVLHMSCVAEDPSVVKWLLEIGSDINRSFHVTGQKILFRPINFNRALPLFDQVD